LPWSGDDHDVVAAPKMSALFGGVLARREVVGKLRQQLAM
jgi:hypothetical protein